MLTWVKANKGQRFMLRSIAGKRGSLFFHSVPHALVRQKVVLRITRSTIEVLARGR